MRCLGAAEMQASFLRRSDPWWPRRDEAAVREGSRCCDPNIDGPDKVKAGFSLPERQAGPSAQSGDPARRSARTRQQDRRTRRGLLPPSRDTAWTASCGFWPQQSHMAEAPWERGWEGVPGYHSPHESVRSLSFRRQEREGGHSPQALAPRSSGCCLGSSWGIFYLIPTLRADLYT